MKLSECTTVEELKACIAELEAKLAKETRPEPAVGQVWRNSCGESYLIADSEGDPVNVYGDCSAFRFGSLAEAGPSKFCTYVGVWDGVFHVKEEPK